MSLKHDLSKDTITAADDSPREENEIDQFTRELTHLVDLPQEDKFFLIQQIEDLNKNIRYTASTDPGQEDDYDSPHKFRSPTKRASVIRGGRGLDIILDEEEEQEGDLSSDQHPEDMCFTKHDGPIFEGCDIVEDLSVHSSFDLKERKHASPKKGNRHQITSIS